MHLYFLGGLRLWVKMLEMLTFTLWTWGLAVSLSCDMPSILNAAA